MPQYDFQSNAGAAIQKYLLDQAARDRQAQLDAQALAHQQETERLARATETRANELALQNKAVQDSQMKIQQAQEGRVAQTFEAAQHQVGDSLTPGQASALPPQMSAPIAPAMTDTVTPELDPTKQQGIFPGIIASSAPGVGSAGPSTGRVFKGNDKQQAMDELMKMNSAKLTPEIKAMIRAGVIDDTALARLLAPTSSTLDEPILRTNYQKGLIEQYKGVTQDGKPIWEPYNSPTRPKGSTIMNEPDPLLSQQRGVTIQLGNQMAGNFGQAGNDLPKEVVDTINSATMNLIGRKRGVVRQTLAASYDPEDPSTFKTQLTNAVVTGEDPQTGRAVEGRRDALKALDQAETIMAQLKAKGVDTNILRGSAEDLVRKLGLTTDPQLVALGSQLNQTLFEYRRAMTGVQFSQKEAEAYVNIFPKYTNDFDVNATLVKQMRTFMGQQQHNFWTQRLGKNADEFVQGTVWESVGDNGPAKTTTTTTETPYQRYLRMQRGQ